MCKKCTILLAGLSPGPHTHEVGTHRHAGSRVLVVDDHESGRVGLAELLREEGFEVQAAADGFKALGRAAAWGPDIVVTDLKMPGLDGIELLRRLRDQQPDIGAVVMTAHGSVESAVTAMHKGADHYLIKPINLGELLVVMGRILDGRALREENRRLREALSAHNETNVLGTGRSREFRKLEELVRQVAPADSSALILGESGTGKELVARALHRLSARGEGPFVAVHCAALGEGVLESELFGHEKGAFTGAVSRRDGRFVQANGGTLFLDEVGEIPPGTQVKLLRVLQDRKVERVGGHKSLQLDVRLVTATNRDLPRMVENEEFREDLFYRLNVITIRVPTLRERIDDIPLLAARFLRRLTEAGSAKVTGFTDAALERLMASNWPGNVRQLENAVERAAVLCRGDEIDVRDLPDDLEARHVPTGNTPEVPGASLREMEDYMMRRTLEHVNGNAGRAADILEVSRRKVHYWLAKNRDAAGRD